MGRRKQRLKPCGKQNDEDAAADGLGSNSVVLSLAAATLAPLHTLVQNAVRSTAPPDLSVCAAHARLMHSFNSRSDDSRPIPCEIPVRRRIAVVAQLIRVGEERVMGVHARYLPPDRLDVKRQCTVSRYADNL